MHLKEDWLQKFCMAELYTQPLIQELAKQGAYQSTGNNGAVTNISTLPSIASTGVYSTPSNLMITLPQTFASSGEFQIRFTTTSQFRWYFDWICTAYFLFWFWWWWNSKLSWFRQRWWWICPDAIEGSGNFNPSTTASGTLTTQSPNINFGIAVDANGIPTTVGASGQGIETL